MMPYLLRSWSWRLGPVDAGVESSAAATPLSVRWMRSFPWMDIFLVVLPHRKCCLPASCRCYALSRRAREGRSTVWPRSLPLYLQHIALARNHLVQHRIDEEPDEKAGDEAGNDDDGKRPLRIRSDACGKSRRQQSEAGDQSRHHDRTEPKQRSFPCGLVNAHPFLAELVDVGDEDDGRLHGNPQQRHKTQDRGNAEGSVRELQCHERTHRLGHDHTQGNGGGEFEVSVEGKQDHENQHHGEWTSEVHLRFGFEKLAVFAAP